MGSFLLLYVFYTLKVFFLVGLILLAFGLNISYKKLLIISLIQGTWDTVVFNGSLNLILGIMLMTISLFILTFFVLKLSPIITLIIGLTAQSFCLILKFGGMSLTYLIIQNNNIYLSKFLFDFLPLSIEVIAMILLFYYLKIKKVVFFNICELIKNITENEQEQD